jgi:D-glycero-D-manno-heptose 1,7-bisphosphate phosphatase
MFKLIVLDRDGVINQDSPEFIKSPEEWHAIPGSLAAIAKLNRLGCPVVVATNQSGIARGLYTLADLELIHAKMLREIEAAGGHIDGVFICPHGPEDNCDCRKPKPGLLLQIAKKFNVEPSEMLTIGDSMRDILAAKACGAAAILVKTGNGRATIEQQQVDVPIYDDLASVAESLSKI